MCVYLYVCVCILKCHYSWSSFSVYVVVGLRLCESSQCVPHRSLKNMRKQSQQKFEYMRKRRAASLTQCPSNLSPPPLSLKLSFLSFHLFIFHCTLSHVPYMRPGCCNISPENDLFCFRFLNLSIYRKRARTIFHWHGGKNLIKSVHLCQRLVCVVWFVILFLILSSTDGSIFVQHRK